MTTLGAQRSGAPLFDNAPRAYDALLVLSFGGPEGMDDVMPFLENVTRGRNIPRERLEEVAEHYAHFGGVSPINAQNRALIAALERELADHGIDLPIYFGNRNWHPLLQDTIEAMRADGVRNVLLFVTSAYSSYSSCRQYREDVSRALERWPRRARHAIRQDPRLLQPPRVRGTDGAAGPRRSRSRCRGIAATRPRSSSPRIASRSRWPKAAPTSASCARSAGSWPDSPAPRATGSPGRAAADHRTSRGSSPTFSTSWIDLHAVRRARRDRGPDRVHLGPSRSALRSRRRGAEPSPRARA